MSNPGTIAEGETAGPPTRAGAGDDLALGVTLRGFSEGHKVFGRYVLRRVLGRGGMGVVWLASDEELDRDVAIKFLPELVCLDREAIHELKRETRRSLELTHPNIVRIYDFEQDDQTAGITMEFIDGKTLSTIKIEQPGRCLGVSQIVPWVEQLCVALDYAHRKARVVHRDLKPANLMLTSEGDIKISDFGISCSISDSVSRVSLARGSSGTPVYMSPQQALGEKPNVQDDVYALGASIYDLLTGKPPFHSGDILTQLREIAPPPMTRRREDLGNRGEAIPAAWEDVVAACLAKEPGLRPASAAEVAERLGLAVPSTTRGRGPAPAAPASASPARPRKPVHRALLVAAVLVGALAVGIGLLSTHLKNQAALNEEVARRNAETAAHALAQQTAAQEKPPAPPPKTESSLPPIRPITPAPPVAQPSQPPPAQTHPQPPPAQTPAQPQTPPPTAPVVPPPAPSVSKMPSPAEPVVPPPAKPAPKTPPPPAKPQVPSPDQDSMATLGLLVQFARDPATPGRDLLPERIDRIVKTYRASLDEVKAAHVARWREPLEAAAEFGSVPAQSLLGEGLTEIDPVAAFKWGLKAAEAGQARAMLDTGRRYRDGKGVEANPAQTRRWLSAAADTGDKESRSVLAYALLQGIGMPPDPPRAVDMFKGLAAEGDPVALDLMGTFHHKGLHGVSKDAAEAFRLYSQAADKGNLDAIANLGVLCIKGEGTAQDPARAAALFRKGAEAGNPRCMEMLAVCLDDGLGTAKDTTAAADWRRKAEAAGKKE